MNQIKVLALASVENAPQLERILENEKINRMLTLVPRSENLERAAAMPVDAVVLFSPVLSEPECRFIEQLYMTHGKIAFVLICESADTEILSAAMRCGIGKVLTNAMDPQTICDGIEEEIGRVLSRSDTAAVRQFDSRVLSVFSTKGGTGKTTIAVNLAVALQQRGKHVALVDLDLQFGDVGVFMNLPRCETISDLAAEATLTPSVINSFLCTHSSGVKVICAPVSPELAETVRIEHIEKLLNVLRPEFDYVICDLAPALDDVTLFAIDHSDCVYFVTNPEVPSLKNARTCIGVLGQLGHAEKIRLVLNRDGDAYVSRADVKTALDLKPAFCIPADAKTAASSINRGIPVVISYPRSKLARAIGAFADAEAGVAAPVQKKPFMSMKKVAK